MGPHVMDAKASRQAPASSRKRVVLLIGTLVTVGVIYLILPKSWFEIPRDDVNVPRPTRGTAAVRGPLREGKSPSTAEHVSALRAEAVKNPLDFGARSRYGMALSSAGRSVDALQEFQAAARLAPDVPGVHHNLGVYYLNTGNLPRADTEFHRELEIIPGDGRAHHFLGLILQARHRDQDAAGQFREAIALAPQLPDAYLSLAIQLTRGNDEAQIRTLADNYVRLTGNKAMADYVVSGAYRTWKRYPEAARYAEMTVQEAPDNYGYWHNLGQIYSYSHRWDDADMALRRAQALSQDPTTVLIELGMNAQRALRYQSAEDYFKNALAASPGSGNIHSYLTRLYRQWHKEAEARNEEKLYRRWELKRSSTSRRAGADSAPIH